MRQVMAIVVGTTVLALALGAGVAWAGGKVTVTREESQPKSVEIKAGEDVEFVNASGGTAHVSFAGSDAVKFYMGKAGSRIKFDKPGTYEYTVHVTATKVHSHTGAVVVK